MSKPKGAVRPKGGSATTQAPALATADVGALSTTQVEALATEQPQALTTAEIKALSSEDLAAMSTDQIVAMFTPATSDVPALTTDQVAAMESFSAGPTTSQVLVLTDTGLALATRDIAALMATEATALAPLPAMVEPAPVVMPGFTSVMYIGKRPEYTDGTYGTRLLFHRGESHWVPNDAAKKMLKHPDVYIPGEAPTAPAVKVPATQTQKEDEDTQDLRDSIANMDKESLFKFSKIHYGQDIDVKMSLAEVRQQVTMLVDQYGIT